MRPNNTRKLMKTGRLFTNVVWPRISPLLGGGKYSSVEYEHQTRLERWIDRGAGIDGFFIEPFDYSKIGIASRVQRAKKPHNSFTIRYRRISGGRTEWHKRTKALNGRFRKRLFPELTVEAYVTRDGKKLLTAGIVRTKALFEYAQRWLGKDRSDRLYIDAFHYDRNEFLVIPWLGLAEEGVVVSVWPYADPTDRLKHSPIYTGFEHAGAA
ncbi:MAG: hypothetical protein GY854_19290 [Deltaproteobacteria bacterium]|nr:hypothetical protein [Deltaproteobacteria bacterium]